MVVLRGDVQHRKDLAADSSSLTLKQCYRLADDVSSEVKFTLGSNPHTPSEVLHHMTVSFLNLLPETEERFQVLETMIGSGSEYSYFWGMLSNWNYPEESLLLLGDVVSYPEVSRISLGCRLIEGIVRHKNTPTDVRVRLYEQVPYDEGIMTAVVRYEDVSTDVLRRVYEDAKRRHFTRLLLMMAHNPNAPTELVMGIVNGEYGQSYRHTVGVNMLAQHHEPYRSWPKEWVDAHFGS